MPRPDEGDAPTLICHVIPLFVPNPPVSHPANPLFYTQNHPVT